MHRVEGHVGQHGEVLRPVADSGLVLAILVHHYVEPTVQAVFHAPVVVGNLVEALRRKPSAQPIIRRFRRGFPPLQLSEPSWRWPSGLGLDLDADVAAQ